MLPICKTLFLACKPRTELFHVLIRVLDLGGKQTQSVGAVRLEHTDKARCQKAELQTRGGMLRFRGGEVTLNQISRNAGIANIAQARLRFRFRHGSECFEEFGPFPVHALKL